VTTSHQCGAPLIGGLAAAAILFGREATVLQDSVGSIGGPTETPVKRIRCDGMGVSSETESCRELSN